MADNAEARVPELFHLDCNYCGLDGPGAGCVPTRVAEAARHIEFDRNEDIDPGTARTPRMAQT